MPIANSNPETEQKIPFSPLDLQFAGLMEKFAGQKNENLHLAAALVSYFRGRGHICLQLDSFCKAPYLPESGERIERPPLKTWLLELSKSRVVGEPGDFRPLILDDKNRLYLHRYWKYEQDLAGAIKSRIGPVLVDEEILRAGLQKLFPGKDHPDWQKIAAFAAVTRKLTIISGGPGTGKTSTVLKILALLLEQGKPLRIALTAPTGKAVSRLQETIKTAKQNLDCSPEIKEAIPETASTIHRFLGVIPDSPFFRHDAKNQLAADVVVIDEASMVDLALMTKLLAAIPPTSRVIILGDQDQLSSVEAGAVLSDLCGPFTRKKFSESFCDDYERIGGATLPQEFRGAANGLNDCIVQLRRNFRFGDHSPIYRASLAVRSGDFAELDELLAEQNVELQWQSEGRFGDYFKERIVSGYEKFLSARDPLTAITLLNEFRVLAAIREGDFGVAELNRRIERILRERGLIHHYSEWYEGRPIMVTRNDYGLNLFNGDIGVIRREPESGSRAFFLTANNEVRSILPAQLPQHENVFAMTVHKSQGSEFDDVLLVLPQEDNSILTRELIYTGITRAKKTVTLFAREDVLRRALSRSVERSSGLQDKLWT